MVVCTRRDSPLYNNSSFLDTDDDVDDDDDDDEETRYSRCLTVIVVCPRREQMCVDVSLLLTCLRTAPPVRRGRPRWWPTWTCRRRPGKCRAGTRRLP